jgi:hypothetical protein
MIISVESRHQVGVYGFRGTIAYYRAAPVHEIIMSAIAEQPGLRTSDLAKRFGLPLPACLQILHPLLATQLVLGVGANLDLTLQATPGWTPQAQLPVHLLEGDWLTLVLPQPFHGHRILGVIPADRFPFNRSDLCSDHPLADLHGCAFSAAGTYSYHISEGKVSKPGELKQGILIETSQECTAFLGTRPAIIQEDSRGSHLKIQFQGQRLNLDLNLSTDVVRPDLESLGRAAIRQQNQRMGQPAASQPFLLKRYADLTEQERATARGSLFEEVSDVRVHLHELPIRPYSQECYHAWICHLFTRNLEGKGYAQMDELPVLLDAAQKTVACPTYANPTVAELVPRLKGKSKMLAQALADWPTVS